MAGLTRGSASRWMARGATLLEVVVCVAVVGLLCAMLVGALAESRRQASLTQNLGNLQQFASGTASYAAEYDDLIWAFSWREREPNPLGVPSSPVQAAADQAIDIIRRRGDRPDIQRITGWYPAVFYSHLVLLDHLGMELPAPFVAAPEDDLLLLWQRDPLNFQRLTPDVQRPAGSGNSIKRWPYSSSYELGMAFHEYATRVRDGSLVLNTLDQHGLLSSQHRTPQLLHPGHRLADVTFPSQKAMVYERNQRHFGPREMFFLYDDARVPILFADGAGGVRRTGDGNPGFRPNQPNVAAPTLMRHQPRGWEPPTLSGHISDTLKGQYRWTRGGIQGRDFAGPEIDTSDW